MKRRYNTEANNSKLSLMTSVPFLVEVDTAEFKLMVFEVKRLYEHSKLPVRYDDDAGYDLFAASEHIIEPWGMAKISLGIATCFQAGYVAFLWDRSSLGGEGLHRFGGVIDSNYRGEWFLTVFNANPVPFVVEHGDKICQAVIQKHSTWPVAEVEDLRASLRGSKGFGSSGRK